MEQGEAVTEIVQRYRKAVNDNLHSYDVGLTRNRARTIFLDVDGGVVPIEENLLADTLGDDRLASEIVNWIHL